MAAEVKDRREAILQRLQVVLAGIAGVKKCKRNALRMPERDLPAIVIFDSDEDVDLEGYGRKRPPNAPEIVGLVPEIYVYVTGAPGDGSTDDEIGPQIAAFRAKILPAIVNDAVLRSLTHDGDIRYLGMATGLGKGRTMEGEAGFAFRFNYPLFFDKLGG